MMNPETMEIVYDGFKRYQSARGLPFTSLAQIVEWEAYKNLLAERVANSINGVINGQQCNKND